MAINLKMIQSKSIKTLGFAAVLAFAVLFLFQNCADSGPEKKDESSSLADTSPFPFDTTIDTLSYMSCSGTGTNANPRAYYTFRAGAYQNGNGIGLNANFISTITGASQRVDIIQSASSNMGSSLQLAIRSLTQYQTVLGRSGGPQEGEHYYNFMDALSSPVIADRLGRLTDSTDKINYFGGVSGLGGKLVEGSLRFFDGEGQSASVRNYLANEMALTMTYSLPGADGYVARAPDMADPKKVYGKSYRVNFKLWGSQANGINRLLNTVVERDIPSGGILGTWNCAVYDSYVIVRAQDAPGYCSATPDPRSFPNTVQGQSDRVRLEKIRRVLRVEDWWVDLARGCVVPKNSPSGGGGACYGSQTTIAYTAGVPGSGVTTCDVNTCPHYVSVCTKN